MIASPRKRRDYTLVSIAYTKALIERPRCNRPKGRVRCSFRVDQFPRFGRNHVDKSVQDLPALGERTLLDELNHRINNEFASAINFVAVSALRSNDVSVKVALGNVVELLHSLAEVNRALKTPDADVVVDAAEYLHTLCRSMSRSRLDRLGIKLVLATETVWLHSERCWRLGLIVHELITNAARHALFQEGDGEVEVDLSRAAGFVRCMVADNGLAPANVRSGRGLR